MFGEDTRLTGAYWLIPTLYGKQVDDMEPNLPIRLQSAVGDAYRVLKELGGGGMSRVFLADETRLGRKVVLKVLPPELTASIASHRFEREIQLAARLQHPLIVPVLSTGSTVDLLYYVMPYIEGESLQVKLDREGELPVDETLRILRDVLGALQYAHTHGVVHRDIKPGNVLLCGTHAMVTDFGVAKAVTTAAGATTISSVGVVIGTPSHMAPEQAAGDPRVDHRSDIYSVGVLAYEMLTGALPFTAPTPQALLGAHLTQTPQPMTALRDSVSVELNEIVLRCLAKHPADRWQHAGDVLFQLEAILAAAKSAKPTVPVRHALLDRVRANASTGHAGVALWVVGVSLFFMLVSLVLVKLLGLPDWVRNGALALMVAGPLMALVWRRLALRTALVAGGLAWASLAAATVGFVVSRVAGIGPGATLMSAGVLAQRDRIIVADFAYAPGDSSSGEVAEQLLRIDLAQSPAITVMEPSQVSDALTRMRRDAHTSITREVAAEVAVREGIKAFIVAELRSVGAGFVLSARLIEAKSGDGLAAARVKVGREQDLVGAVDRLSAELRARIGESLKQLRDDPPLERVTTASLPALRLYAQAERVLGAGDMNRAISLLEAAVAQDTAFAMAYRRLAILRGTQTARGRAALQRAYAIRDRLSDRERYHVEGVYASDVDQNPDRAVTAYLAILDQYPNDIIAMNNLGVAYGRLGRIDAAIDTYRRATATGAAFPYVYLNLVLLLSNTGALREADSVLSIFATRSPGNPAVAQYRSNLAMARRNFAVAAEQARSVLNASRSVQYFAHSRLADIAELGGRMGEAARERRAALSIQATLLGMSEEERRLRESLAEVTRQLWYAADVGALGRRVEALMERSRTLTMGRTATQFVHSGLIRLLARTQRPAAARRLLEEHRRSFSDAERADANVRRELLMFDGVVATAEGRFSDAVRQFMEACDPPGSADAFCRAAARPEVANAYDRAGAIDSAVAVYERFLAVQAAGFHLELRWNVEVPRRLGELYEARHDPQRALSHYRRFLTLWNRADPQLRHAVDSVTARVARLEGSSGRRARSSGPALSASLRG